MTAFLLEIALRAALMAVGTAAVLRLLRIQSAAVRHSAWTAVVIAMLCLPVWQAGGLRVTLPVLMPAVTNVTPGADRIGAADAAPPAVSHSQTPAPTSTRLPASPAQVSSDWPSTLVSFYVAGVVVLLLRLILGTVEANRLRRSAVMKNGRLTSSRCATPITVGWFRPVLILPDDWERWPAAKLAAVLTHEGSHARRRDPLVQWVALFNRAVFWFHPLAWWLERRLSTLSEEASDAAVLAAGHSPLDYSEYLLDMARSVAAGGRRLHVVGMAMPGSGLTQRMQQIFRELPGVPPSRTRVVSTAALCVMSSVVFASGTLSEHARVRAPLQAAAGMPIKFDLVSIKPCPADQPSTGRGGNAIRGRFSPGHAYWVCESLVDLVDNAWGGFFPTNDLSNTIKVPPNDRTDVPQRVRGGPSWASEERFSLEIALSGDTTDLAGPARVNAVRDAMRPALRAMLEDRFQLKLRKVTEQRPMYAMTVADGGLKITRTAEAGQKCWPVPPETPRGTKATPPPGFEGLPSCSYGVTGRNRRGNEVLDFTHINLTDFAKYLSREMDRYVLDKTGAVGRFSFTLEFAADGSTPGIIETREVFARAAVGLLGPPLPGDPVKADGPSIFRALEALGLKLERTMGPAEYLFIESAQRPKPNLPPAAAAALQRSQS